VWRRPNTYLEPRVADINTYQINKKQLAQFETHRTNDQAISPYYIIIAITHCLYIIQYISMLVLCKKNYDILGVMSMLSTYGPLRPHILVYTRYLTQWMWRHQTSGSATTVISIHSASRTGETWHLDILSKQNSTGSYFLFR